MEVREGFKKTEVGIIPDDWQVTTLAKVCQMKSGDSITSAGIDEFSKYPCYGGNGLRGFTSRFTHDGKYALIGRQGALCGNVLGVEGKFFASEHAIVVTASAKTDIQWLTYVLGEMRLNQYSESSAQPGLSVSKILSLGLALPPTKAEQEAIAEALSDADALIEAVEQLLTKKRQIKQGAMSELLTGKRRLANVKQTILVQTDLGNFPSDWELTPLGAIVDPFRSIRYGIVQPGKYDHQGRFMIRGQDYSKGWVDPSEVFRVSDVVEARYKNARVKTGDLIMTIVGSCGIVETIPEWLDGANLTQTTVRIAILPLKANSQFCKYMLQTEVGALQVNNFMKGAVQPGLNCADVEKFYIPLPVDTTEQTAIAEILSDMDAEITALEGKLVKARQVKAGMMSELLTGKIRLV